ncbi:MAG: hypothetical protein V1644_02735 [Candidatus Micrarchaeota archaeon]
MVEPPELEEIHGESIAPKRIIIKRNHLPVEVQQAVDVLRIQRIKRSTVILEGLIGSGVAALIFLSSKSVPSSEAKAKLWAGLSLLGGAVLGTSYVCQFLPRENRKVNQLTSEVVEKIKEHGLIDASHKSRYSEVAELPKLRETHPLMIVDRKGNVHLIPKTSFEQALHHAQQKFWKHVLPYRKRETY